MVVLGFNIFTAFGGDFAAIVVINTSTSNYALTDLGFLQGLTQKLRGVLPCLMAVVARVAFEETIAVLARIPFYDRSGLRVTKLAESTAWWSVMWS